MKKNLGKKCINSLLLAAVLMSAQVSFASVQNSLLKTDIKASGDSIKVNLYTSHPYNEPLVVNKKSDKEYVIYLPETANSPASKTLSHSPNDLIQGVEIKSQGGNGKKSYTKVRILTAHAVEIQPTVQPLITSSFSMTDDEYRTLMSHAKRANVAPAIRPKKVIVQSSVATATKKAKPNFDSAITAAKAQSVKTAKTAKTTKLAKSSTAKSSQTSRIVLKMKDKVVVPKVLLKQLASNTLSSQKSVDKVTKAKATTKLAKSQTKLASASTATKALTEKPIKPVTTANAVSTSTKVSKETVKTTKTVATASTATKTLKVAKRTKSLAKLKNLLASSANTVERTIKPQSQATKQTKQVQPQAKAPVQVQQTAKSAVKMPVAKQAVPVKQLQKTPVTTKTNTGNENVATNALHKTPAINPYIILVLSAFPLILLLILISKFKKVKPQYNMNYEAQNLANSTEDVTVPPEMTVQQPQMQESQLQTNSENPQFAGFEQQAQEPDVMSQQVVAENLQKPETVSEQEASDWKQAYQNFKQEQQALNEAKQQEVEQVSQVEQTQHIDNLFEEADESKFESIPQEEAISPEVTSLSQEAESENLYEQPTESVEPIAQIASEMEENSAMTKKFEPDYSAVDELYRRNETIEDVQQLLKTKAEFAPQNDDAENYSLDEIFGEEVEENDLSNRVQIDKHISAPFANNYIEPDEENTFTIEQERPQMPQFTPTEAVASEAVTNAPEPVSDYNYVEPKIIDSTGVEDDIPDDEIVKEQYALTNDSGFYLVDYKNTTALIGYVKDDYFVIKQFPRVVSGKIHVKLSEKKNYSSVYMVKAAGFKGMIDIGALYMKVLLEL